MHFISIFSVVNEDKIMSSLDVTSSLLGYKIQQFCIFIDGYQTLRNLCFNLILYDSRDLYLELVMNGTIN